MKYDYIILGAGITAMSCALRLKQKDSDSTIMIIEKRPVSGGLSRSISYKEWTLDLGPHRIYTPYKKVDKYIKDLLGEELLTVKRSSAMYLHGKFVHYPFQMANLISSLPPLRAIQYFFSFLTHKIHLFRQPVNSPGRILQEFSYTGYLESRFGNKIARDVFYPYAGKVWGLEPENLSSWILKKRISSPNLGVLLCSMFSKKKKEALVRKDFNYPRSGMQQMIDAMEKQCRDNGIEFSLNDEVLHINRKAQHWEVQTDNTKRNAQRVISTLPVTDMMELTSNRFTREDKKLQQSFKSLYYRKIFFVYIFVNKSVKNYKSWYYFPGKDLIFSRISNLKLFSSDIGPADKTVLCCEVPLSMSDAPDPETSQFVIRDLERTGLVKREDVEDIYCHSEPYCYPVYDLIFEAKLKIIFQYLARLTNFISTGRQGLFHHNNIDHSILMGWATADYCHNSGFIIDLPNWYFKVIQKFEGFKIID